MSYSIGIGIVLLGRSGTRCLFHACVDTCICILGVQAHATEPRLAFSFCVHVHDVVSRLGQHGFCTVNALRHTMPSPCLLIITFASGSCLAHDAEAFHLLSEAFHACGLHAYVCRALRPNVLVHACGAERMCLHGHSGAPCRVHSCAFGRLASWALALCCRWASATMPLRTAMPCGSGLAACIKPRRICQLLAALRASASTVLVLAIACSTLACVGQDDFAAIVRL
jgi:hypothetical protein